MNSHIIWEQAFQQYGVINNSTKIDTKKKEIFFNILKDKYYIYNQVGLKTKDGDERSKYNQKFQKILLDSQSMYNVIVNRVFLCNIRYCK